MQIEREVDPWEVQERVFLCFCMVHFYKNYIFKNRLHIIPNNLIEEYASCSPARSLL